MIFQKVFHCNLDKLVLCYKNIVNSKDISVKYFGEKDSFYFKTVKISYILSGVSDLDLLIFDSLGAYVSVSSDNVKLPNFNSNLVDNEIVGKKVWSLYQNIQNKDKQHLLPISFVTHDVIVEFSGNSVINLLGLQPIQTLKVNNDFTLPSEKILEEILFEVLYKKFYLQMEKKLSSVDLLTDVSLQNQYYKFLHSKSYKLPNLPDDFEVYRSYDSGLACVNTPVGSLNFLESNKVKFTNSLSIIKSNLIKNNIKNDSDSIEYLFMIESDFSTFMKLFIETNFIINYEDLKVILFNGNRILNENAHLLEVNLIEMINTHIDSLRKIYNSDLKYNEEHKKEIQLGNTPRNRVNKLELYNWICGCTQIRYMIKFNLKELEEFIDKLNKVDYIDFSLMNLNNIIFNIKNHVYMVKKLL